MRVILLAILCLFFLDVSAQRSCGSDEHHAHMIQTNPAYAKRYKQSMAMTKLTPAQKASLACSGTTVIPIAVHFNDPVNCDNYECLLEAVEAQIDVLNEDFSATNDDYDNYLDWNSACPSEYPLSTAPDQGTGTCLQFCLARQNHPSGSGLSDGDPAITVGEFTFSGGASVWDGYLNFFVSNEFGFLGLSPLPGSGNGDGVWVVTNSFGGPGSECFSGGTINGSNTYGLGRTATHELGHYFGLPHVFGNCGDSDSNPPGPVNINDTPGQNSPFFGNPTINDCGDVITQCSGNPVSFFSFMDYTDDAGMIIFTADQSDVVNHWGNSIGFVSDATVCSGSYGAPECAGLSLPLALELLDTEDPGCTNEATGTIEVEATGGAGDYTYELNGGESNNTGIFTGLTAGTYTVSVFDGTNSFEIEVELEEPDPLEVMLVETINLTCFDSEDGTIEITIDGGTPGYDVDLNGDGMGDDTVFDNLAPDTYTIIVEDDNGCTNMIEATITAPAEMLLTLVTQTDPTCGGYTDGQVNLMAAGGTVTGNNYTYSADGVDFQDSPNFEDLGAGMYTFIVEDENACQVMLPVEIFEPDPVLIEVTDSNESVSCNGNNDGFVNIEGSNTLAPYTYSMDGMNYTTSGEFIDLPAGDYTFYVQDDNSCVSTLDISIGQPDPLMVDIAVQSEISCNGASDATIQLSGEGGTANYDYFMDDLNTPVTDLIENLDIGDYSFIIVDANGCMNTSMISVTQPDPIDVTTNEIVEVECFGEETGSANFSAAGGNGDFEYEIDGVINTDGMFTGMTSGTYVLAVTDGNDCTQELIFDIGQTSDLELEVTINMNNNCAGETNGSFTLEGNGGVGNYQYGLDPNNFSDVNTFSDLPGGIYDVFIIDDNNCITVNSAIIDAPEAITLGISQIGELQCFDAANGVLSVAAEGGAEGFSYQLENETNDTGIFMDLTAGSYLVVVTDDNGCSDEIEYTIEAPEELINTIQTANNTCEGQTVGTINISSEGGTGVITYEVEGEENTTGVFENLDGGSYTVVMFDENDCTIIETVEIVNDVNLSIDLINTISPTCNDTEDGSISVNTSGGAGPFTYFLGTATNTTGTFDNLPAGDYMIMVEDPNGCTSTLDIEVTPTPLIDLANAEINNVMCFGELSGSVSLDAGGGSGTLSFTLDGETNTTGEFDNLAAGEYELLVMDENNCETISMITIDEPIAIQETSTTATAINCFGENTGEINIAGTGGTGSLSYSIDGLGSNADGIFTELSGGMYDVVISDENNCSIVQSVLVEEPTEIQPQAVLQMNIDCFGEATGGIELATTGGTGTYMYTLDGQQSTEGLFGSLSAGTYTTMVADDSGCEVPFVFTIEQPDELLLEPTATDAGAEEGGSIDLNIIGGTGPYLLNLTDGTMPNAENSFVDLEPGIYTVEVTDDKGCYAEIEVEIRLIDLYVGQPDGITLNETICPNPASDIITIKYESTSDQNVIFEFYDDAAKYIGRFANYSTTGVNTFEVDVRDFANGTYVLKIVADRDESHVKLIKID